MSKLLNFGVVNAQALGGASGIAIGSVCVTPAAAIGTVSISDSTGVILTMTVPANGGTVDKHMADSEGAITTGPTTITTTGAGISVTVEMM